MIYAEEILSKLWMHDEKSAKEQTMFVNIYQKWFFILMLLSFGFSLLSAVLSLIYPQIIFVNTAQYLSLLGQISGLLFHIFFIFEGLKLFKNPLQCFLKPIILNVNNDLKLSNSLCEYEIFELKHISKTLALHSSILTSRTSLIFGALERIGLIPLCISWFVIYLKFSGTNTPNLNAIDWILYPLFIIYLLALFLFFFKHKLERYVFVIDQALVIKSNNKET